MENAKPILSHIKAVLSWPVAPSWFGVLDEAITPAEQREEAREGAAPIPVAQDLKEAPTIQTPQDRYAQLIQLIIKEFQEKPEEAAKDVIWLLNSYRFERAYNLIFGTQIDLLKHLAAIPGQNWRKLLKTLDCTSKQAQKLEFLNQVRKELTRWPGIAEHLATKGEEGESYVNLHGFYLRYTELIQASGPAEYEYAAYMGFLEDQGFIEIDRVDQSRRFTTRITAFGVDFLSYIKTQYKSYKSKSA